MTSPQFVIPIAAPAHYEVTLRLDPPAVCNGKLRNERESKAKLGVCISGGGGRVKAGKIWVSLPVGLLDPKDPGKQYSTVHVERTGPGPTEGTVAGKIVPGRVDEGSIQEFGFIASPLDVFLLPWSQPEFRSSAPTIVGEMVSEAGFPIMAELNISETAPEGDHEINAVLTYLTTTGWRGSRASVRIHVYTWAEKWQNWIVRGGLLLTVLGVIAAVLVVRP